MNKLEVVLVTGSNGLLAQEIKICFSNKIKLFFFNKKDLDITNYSRLFNICNDYNPSYIINTAAYTNTEKSEILKKISYNVNVLGVQNLIKVSKIFSIKLIHFSSDYIFNGNKKIPYKENNKPNPINYYGITKLLSENEIINQNYKNYMIIRTSMLYSIFNKNILTNLILNFNKDIDLKFIDNIICSPTSAYSLAEFLNFIVLNKKFKPGIYNFCDSGICSNYEFASYVNKIILKNKLLKSRSQIYPINFIDYKSKILRPQFSALDNNKVINKFDYKINNWKKNLENIIIKYFK